MATHAEQGAAAARSGNGRAVCVTGAGGYIASWLVKLLLSRGYAVHGTVRDLSDKKTAHLKRLDHASERLQLFRADLLDYDALAAAVAGCEGVFHVATPVPSGNLTDPEREMLGPAVTGTKNVLDAALAAKVRKVVVVSSMVTVEINPKDWPHDKIKDENCWSDKEFCMNNEDWYSVAKITAEEAALEYGRQIGLDVVTINPALVLGPPLQSMCNTSCQFLIYFLKGGPDQMRNKLWHIVDVRDVADALLLIYEAPEASGRHICAPHFISARDLLRLLKNMYPDYPCITEESICDMDNTAPMTSDKLKQLGWSCRPLEERIADTGGADGRWSSARRLGFLMMWKGSTAISLQFITKSSQESSIEHILRTHFENEIRFVNVKSSRNLIDPTKSLLRVQNQINHCKSHNEQEADYRALSVKAVQ